jgi:hypothetical protein
MSLFAGDARLATGNVPTPLKSKSVCLSPVQPVFYWQNYIVDEEWATVILATLRNLQLKQDNIVALIGQRDFIAEQRHVDILTKFQEGASGRKLLYDKMQMVEDWLASLVPPPSQPSPGEELGSFLDYPQGWDGLLFGTCIRHMHPSWLKILCMYRTTTQWHIAYCRPYSVSHIRQAGSFKLEFFSCMFTISLGACVCFLHSSPTARTHGQIILQMPARNPKLGRFHRVPWRCFFSPADYRATAGSCGQAKTSNLKMWIGAPPAFIISEFRIFLQLMCDIEWYLL